MTVTAAVSAAHRRTVRTTEIGLVVMAVICREVALPGRMDSGDSDELGGHALRD